jgi:hypothetical protein
VRFVKDDRIATVKRLAADIGRMTRTSKGIKLLAGLLRGRLSGGCSSRESDPTRVRRLRFRGIRARSGREDVPLPEY